MNFSRILFVLFLLSSGGAFAQLPLAGKWSYSFTDDKASSAVEFDASAWKTTEGNKLKWDQELPKTSNIVWIRKKVVIPSSLKSELAKTGTLMAYFGRIKQEDKFYFNGKYVDETNSGDIRRAYLLNEQDILWDKENVLAVRISHWGGSSSVESEPAILAAKPAQLFLMSAGAEGVTPKQQVANKDAVYVSKIKNRSPRVIAAKLVVDFYDIAAKKLKSVQQTISLKPGENTVRFPYKSASPFLKITYALSIPTYSYAAEWNDIYGYIDLKHQPAQPALAYKAKEVFSPAQLGQQTVAGWLGEKMKANKEQRLEKVDEAALLAGFINKPGVHPWIGEHVGKYLEAAANTYKNTKDPQLKIQLDRTAQQLIAAQLTDGYLGTYEPASQWTSWDVWSHKYDLVGLLAYYETTGYKPALLACQKIGDLLCKRFGSKPGQLDIIKSGAHVGMAATSILDPMTDLYRFSGKKEYLDFCYYITEAYNVRNGPRIIATLDSVGRVDKTANAKAYEMMSNLVGLVKLYRVTGDEKVLKPVLTAWKDIATKRLYITGTTSSFEHFQDDHVLPAEVKDHMGEGCVTTTWVQFNLQLLSLFGKMEYVDELERAVYNHLIGAENPQTGCVSYYTPLMGAKPYGCNITCCMSSVPRGIAMIPLFANGKINNSPAFLFYQPGVYQTSVNGKAVEFTTTTRFPAEGDVTIAVNPATPDNFAVLLRKPYWAADFKVTVNGTPQTVGGDEVVSLNRKWAKGDKIAVNFTLPVKVLDGGISYPGTVAFQRGPQILVADNKLNPAVSVDFKTSATGVQLQEAKSALPEKWVGNQAYRVAAEVNGKTENVVLVPYADAGQTGGVVTTWLKKQ